MLILAIDSTAVSGSVAICRDATPIAAFHIKNGNTHSETLLPMVEAALNATSLTVDDIDLFAVNKGPGSFTGVRIGVSTVKGLAFGKNKPCIGISTLESLAENLLPCPDGTLLVPVMNARRAQVYNALFRVENGEAVRLTPDRAIAVTELEAELAEPALPFLLVGDGIDEACKGFKTLTPMPCSPLLSDQNAVSVAKCAYRRYMAGERESDAELAPLYLRLPQAERERLERLSRS